MNRLRGANLDALPVFRERTIIGVLLVCFLDEYERFPVHKPADVINVTVGVIARRAFAQPQDVFYAEIFLERFVVLRLRHAGIPDLDFGMQITFLGGEQRPATVDLDAAAFDDKIPALELRDNNGRFRSLAAISGTWCPSASRHISPRH